MAGGPAPGPASATTATGQPHLFLMDLLAREAPRRRRALRGGPRRPGAASTPSGCGSSIPSTAPGSSASPAAPTGPCTWPSPSTASRSPAPWPCPPAASRSRTDPPPAAPPAVRRTSPASSCPAPARRTRRTLVQEALGGRLVPMGSAGAKAMAVVLGEADVYAHSGGQYEWDNAAPAAVAARRRPPRQPARRQPAPLQPGRPVAPRPADLPARPRRAGAAAPCTAERRRVRRCRAWRSTGRRGAVAAPRGRTAARPAGRPNR